jgi:hypothetical protein
MPVAFPHESRPRGRMLIVTVISPRAVTAAVAIVTAMSVTS